LYGDFLLTAKMAELNHPEEKLPGGVKPLFVHCKKEVLVESPH
jgi:hypothetical protein